MGFPNLGLLGLSCSAVPWSSLCLIDTGFLFLRVFWSFRGNVLSAKLPWETTSNLRRRPVNPRLAAFPEIRLLLKYGVFLILIFLSRTGSSGLCQILGEVELN